MNKRIYAVLAIFVMISAIALVSGPHILGATTMSGTNIELSSMTLSQIADKNSTLVVDVTVKHKVGLSGNYTFELLVDDNIVVNETKTFGSFDEKKIISLKWPVQVGTHILLVRAEGSELETLVRVTKSYGKFEIVELRDGEDTFQTHALDFKAGAEYDILVEQNDIIRAEFESQTYIFTILNIGESSVQLDFSSLSINLNILEDRAVDLNGDGTVDVNILLNKIDSDGASITIKSKRVLTILDVVINFWWLALIIAMLIAAILLMRKYELQRTKYGRRLLKRIKRYRSKGVLKESLYKKARRTLKKKLKP